MLMEKKQNTLSMTLHISDTGPVKPWAHNFRTSAGQFVPFPWELQLFIMKRTLGLFVYSLLDCIFLSYIVLLISGSGGVKLSDLRFSIISQENGFFRNVLKNLRKTSGQKIH